MMEVLLQTYYILLPIIATALVGWVGVLLKDQKKKEKDRDEIQKKKRSRTGAGTMRHNAYSQVYAETVPRGIYDSGQNHIQPVQRLDGPVFRIRISWREFHCS